MRIPVLIGPLETMFMLLASRCCLAVPTTSKLASRVGHVAQCHNPRSCTTITLPLRRSSPAQRQAQLSSHVGNPQRRCSSTASLTTPAAVTCSIHTTSPKNDIATLTIRNPAKLNILSQPIIDALLSHCKALSVSPSLRAVVLTGGPVAANQSPSFIGGADIREMHALSCPAEAETFITRLHEICQELRELPVPVVARIHGLCLGAGLEVAVSCDVRVATHMSRLGMPETAIGIPSVIEAALLPGLIGFGRTRRLLLLGETVDGVEAERWGLVEKVVGDEKALDAAVEEWVVRIIKNGPQAVRSQKRLIRRWEEGGVESGIAAGVEAFGEAFKAGGREPRELMERFLGRKNRKR